MVRRNIHITSITIFMNVAVIFTWYYLTPIYLKQLGATDWLVGVAYASMLLGFTSAQVVGGYLSDRFGRKGLIVLPTYAGAALYALMAFTKSPYIFILLAALSEVVSSMQMPSFISLVFESSSSESKGKSFSFLEGSVSAGLALGTLSGAFLLKFTDIPHLFIITAIVVGIAGILRHIFLEETLKTSKKKGNFRLPFTRNLLWFIVSGIFFGMILNAIPYGPFPTLFYKEIRSLSDSYINFVFSMGNIAAALSSIAGAFFIGELNAKKVFSVSIVAWGSILFVWILTGGNIWIFAISFVFQQYCLISSNLMLSSMSSAYERAKVVGLYESIVGTISAASPFVGMWIKLRYGYTTLILSILLMTFLSMLFMLKVTYPSSSARDT